MTYSETLASRIREILGGRGNVSELRAFGGLAFLVNGNMAVAANSKGEAMVRVDPAEAEDLLAEVGVAPTVMRGRTMRGWLDLSPEALAGDRLAVWVERGLAYAATLPPK